LTSAYLLVTHGSRDPRSQIGVEHLAHLVRRKLAFMADSAAVNSYEKNTALVLRSQPALLATAVLEGGSQTLAQQIIDFSQTAIAQNCQKLVIFPIFLLPGVHVREDIPIQVAQAQTQISHRIALILNPYLGSQRGMKALLAERFASLPPGQRLLLAHGTRLREGTELIETLAQSLDAIPAYWSVEPSLATQISKLTALGQKSFAICPYFLFAGGITDAIAKPSSNYAKPFPRAT
jgi:hypothetical protein